MHWNWSLLKILKIQIFDTEVKHLYLDTFSFNPKYQEWYGPSLDLDHTIQVFRGARVIQTSISSFSSRYKASKLGRCFTKSTSVSWLLERSRVCSFLSLRSLGIVLISLLDRSSVFRDINLFNTQESRSVIPQPAKLKNKWQIVDNCD